MRKKVKIYPTALAVSGLILGMPATVSAQERLTQESETDAEIAYLRNQLTELQAREAEARPLLAVSGQLQAIAAMWP